MRRQPPHQVNLLPDAENPGWQPVSEKRHLCKATALQQASPARGALNSVAQMAAHRSVGKERPFRSACSSWEMFWKTIVALLRI
jgi:hypothetical protein